jgi:hypothetical protein
LEKRSSRTRATSCSIFGFLTCKSCNEGRDSLVDVQKCIKGWRRGRSCTVFIVHFGEKEEQKHELLPQGILDFGDVQAVRKRERLFSTWKEYLGA